LTGHEIPNHVYGWGLIDVEAAFERLDPSARLLPDPVDDSRSTRVVPARP